VSLNTVPSLGPVGGAALAAHPDVDKLHSLVLRSQEEKLWRLQQRAT